MSIDNILKKGPQRSLHSEGGGITIPKKVEWTDEIKAKVEKFSELVSDVIGNKEFDPKNKIRNFSNDISLESHSLNRPLDRENLLEGQATLLEVSRELLSKSHQILISMIQKREVGEDELDNSFAYKKASINVKQAADIVKELADDKTISISGLKALKKAIKENEKQ